MKPSDTITVPEVIERFTEYKMKPQNGAWGSLHVVLDDQNVEDSNVEFCIEQADQLGDKEGAELGRILLKMSKSQRYKISKLA